MWPAALTRFLRRRLLYLIVATVVIVFYFSNIFGKSNMSSSLQADELPVQRTQPLIWRVLSGEASNRTNDPDLQCRNSVQGRDLLVDERGFLCNRDHILPNGCCNAEVESTNFQSCQTCNASTHCCGVYEYCVSCCLHPDKRPLLEQVLNTITGRQARIYAAVEDHFELCLVKCRTNSHSVEHENKYRSPKTKYCYGLTYAHESQLEVSEAGLT